MTRKLQLAIVGIVLCLTSALHAETSTPSSDQNCLAEAIYREAGGEKLIGQYAVGEVIMNRVHAGVATSPCSVVKQHVGKHWQFGFNATGNKGIPRKRLDYFITVAQHVLDGSDDYYLPSNVLYFNNIPFRSKGFRLYRKIGNQFFYTKNGDVELKNEKSVPLYGSHEILVHQNIIAREEGLGTICDDKQLKSLIKEGALVAIPVSSHLVVAKGLPKNRRFCRPWTAEFLTNIGDAYYAQFGKPLIIDSAVRTVKVQRSLLHWNRNAAAISGDAASPHLTGIAIDINKKKFSNAELEWMRNYLSIVGMEGNLDVEEEFQQLCFHVSVYRTYSAFEIPDLFRKVIVP